MAFTYWPSRNRGIFLSHIQAYIHIFLASHVFFLNIGYTAYFRSRAMWSASRSVKNGSFQFSPPMALRSNKSLHFKYCLLCTSLSLFGLVVTREVRNPTRYKIWCLNIYLHFVTLLHREHRALIYILFCKNI